MPTVTPGEERIKRDDADLARRCSRGDRDAFHELTQRYYRPVCGFLFKRLGAADVVEDLAQETFLEAYRMLIEGRGPTHVSSWLFGIASNRCGKWLRRKRPGFFPAGAPPEDVLSVPFCTAAEELEEQQSQMAALDGGLAGLPDETRRLLDMKHRQGLTCEQIAAATGQPVGTIKSTLARTYKLLRGRLSRAGGED